ncbi:helix-turn-helix domain-containing protein [Candidatus Pacearchaeota archaeon]|nr:helix-turn-helix domain-containing protein [Candidatus Pacearchaeota archaeon]
MPDKTPTTTPPEPTSRLMTPKDAAAYLAISARKLWQLTKDGRLPCVKFDRVKRYDTADLDSFIAKCKGAI